MRQITFRPTYGAPTENEARKPALLRTGRDLVFTGHPMSSLQSREIKVSTMRAITLAILVSNFSKDCSITATMNVACMTMGDLIRPRTWAQRSMGMPVLPGAKSTWLITLHALIEELSTNRQPASSDQVSLPRTGGLNRYQFQRLVRAGLLAREGATVMPSAAATSWQQSGDPAVLVQALHCNVRFVGEAMDALYSGPRTHEQLLRLAREEFDLQWDTPAPVRDRTGWLAVTGMVELFDRQVHLTEAGRRVLATIELGKPEPDGTDTVVQLAPTPGAIARLVEQLDEAGLRDRADGANLYIPGVAANGGMLDALQVLTEAAIPSVSDEEFVRFVQSNFPKAQTVATARTAKDTLKALGLIQRTSSKSWAATPAALAWVASGEPLDLARTVHAAIAFFCEVLGELDHTVRPTTGTLTERSSLYLPNRGKPLSRSAVNTRLNLLHACGLVTRLSQTTYRTTTLGRAFKDSLPCFQPNDAASRAPSDGTTDNHHGDGLSGITHQSSSTASHIAAELEDAARDSAKSKRLEKAAIVALSYLGMPGQHVGGPGAVDGHVRFGVGTDSRTLAIEAKTSATGPVRDQPLFGLPEHRARVGAHVHLLIGPGFERRMLKEADDDPAIAVIDTGLLAEVVRRQEQTPLTLAQLAPLVDPALKGAHRGDAMRGCWEAQDIRSRLEYALVDILNAEAEDPLEEGGWLDLTSIRRELRTRGYRVDEGTVVEALEFLVSSRIGALQRSEQRYRCTASVHTAGQRIRALGYQWVAAAELHQAAHSGDEAAQA
ncbi:hypothetical protein [Streptomyces sp. NPDC048516]|uniref:hypothetical protein n=1 Tax=Streptomyces sp. NPDC048516 TaxID=3365565 RepID=UPI00370F860F